ncbi:DUF6223 family protein [Pseudonocardia lacus]|uniref:DUF6223 family protein n=2 Tax=Pseudonocardia lacus TaxID=2835865 RepID=UPI002028BFBC|nr:DUF6223 family protein [Pseudonocardia lacus]
MSASLLAATDAVHHWAAAGGYTLGTGRTVPSVAAVVGLISAVGGWLALARPGRVGNRRRVAGAAVVAGLLGAAVGGVHAATAAGGLGTGNGLAGAVIAVVVGLVGVVLGGLALARSRRPVPPSTRGSAG